MTYMYYSFIGCFVTIVVGWTISYFTGKPSDLYDEELIHPWARKLAHLFPGKKRLYSHKEVSEIEEERNEKINGTKFDSSVIVHPSTSSSNDGKKYGTLNPTFSPEVSEEPVDGIFKTKL